MKILYIANSRMPTEKAHGLQIVKTMEAFLLQGAEVELVLPRRRNHIEQSIQEFYQVQGVPTIHWIGNYFGWLETLWHQGYFSLQRMGFGVMAFWYALCKRGYIIYSREITLCFFLSLCGKKVVFEDHEPKKSFGFVYDFFLRCIPKKVIVAELLQERYAAAGVKEKSFVLAPNGVDLKEFQNGTQREIWQNVFSLQRSEKIVLYVGHFYPWKGVYTLLDAAAHIDGIVVLVGGIEQDRKKVEQYIAQKNIRNVVVHPFLPHHEVVPFIQSADVVVLPNTSQEERSQKYTTPIKLFEYLASGVPLVASRLPSFQKYLHHEKNCLLVNPDEPQALANVVNILLHDATVGRILVSQAKQDVQQWTWNSRAQKILSFLQT